MPLPGPGLLQTSSDPPLGLVIALVAVFAVVALLALRGFIDWVRGPNRETATYRLVEAGEGLALVEAREPDEGRLIGLDEDAMRDFLDRVEHRNEMRLETVVDAEGNERSWRDWRGQEDRPVPNGVVIKDSKGRVEVDRQGRVTAQPPMDDAVRGDFLDVLTETVGRSG